MFWEPIWKKWQNRISGSEVLKTLNMKHERNTSSNSEQGLVFFGFELPILDWTKVHSQSLWVRQPVQNRGPTFKTHHSGAAVGSRKLFWPPALQSSVSAQPIGGDTRVGTKIGYTLWAHKIDPICLGPNHQSWEIPTGKQWLWNKCVTWVVCSAGNGAMPNHAQQSLTLTLKHTHTHQH